MDHWAVFGSVADWAQAISSTVVLVLIYQQMKQTTAQMVQNDDQERFRRSWEFVKLYREELRDFDRRLESYGDTYSFDALAADPESDDFRFFVTNFFRPRIDLFVLLNQLLQRQEVDERVLFGYLEHEFNRFVEIGIRRSPDFKKEIGLKISLLLTLWGTHIKASNVLYSAP